MATWLHEGAALAGRDGSVEVVALGGCRILWHTDRGPAPTKLEWSSDGSRLVLSPPGLRVYDARGRLVAQDNPSDATHDADATLLPGSRAVAGIRVHGGQSDVFMLRTGRSLFHVSGRSRKSRPPPRAAGCS